MNMTCVKTTTKKYRKHDCTRSFQSCFVPTLVDIDVAAVANFENRIRREERNNAFKIRHIYIIYVSTNF